jgi:hypothetical protein
MTVASIQSETLRSLLTFQPRERSFQPRRRGECDDGAVVPSQVQLDSARVRGKPLTEVATEAAESVWSELGALGLGLRPRPRQAERPALRRASAAAGLVTWEGCPASSSCGTLWVCNVSGGPFQFTVTRPSKTPLGL